MHTHTHSHTHIQTHSDTNSHTHTYMLSQKPDLLPKNLAAVHHCLRTVCVCVCVT